MTLTTLAAAALTALAATAAPSAPARADDDVRASLVVHGRFTDRENTPSSALLYDRSARTLDLAPYLRPQGSDAYASMLASAGLEGRLGWLRWAVTADTGELRTRRFQETSAVCGSTLTPTGLAVEASGLCNVTLPGRLGRPPSVTLEDTRLQPAVLTSNGRALADEARSTLLLREAWVGAAMGQNDFALVRVGRKRFTVGDGFIYDDYGTGVEASLDLGALGPSFDVGAAAFYPTRDFPRATGLTSPMLALRADWLPSLFEHAGLFLAAFRDRSDSLAPLFQASLAESSAVDLGRAVVGTPAYKALARAVAAALGSDRHSDGTLVWLGTSGSLRVLGPVRLDWTGAVERGRLTLGSGAAQVQSDVRGQLAWLRLRGDPARTLELSAFFLYLSGDLPPDERRRLGLPAQYGGFLGVAPYVTTTNIFFQGGVAETFAARQATAPGVNGRGVMAPGLGATFEPVRALAFDLRAAWLVAPELGPFGGKDYGPEVDLGVTWSPVRWLVLLAEADALFPGDFFPGRATVTKVVLGVDLVWP
ncbi:MAG TPA: hypothetical protein VEM76_16400 [Anaeromyxobacteraceae bacterium]|nr:hypothetical protein [Anaeromyxobacteraceae bacterium]